MTDQLLVGSYDYRLVVLSVLIAILAAYTALDLGERITASRDWARLYWLLGGAASMGIGIWSMHYIGMLAFSLPVPILYDWPTVLLSLVSAILASEVALFVVSRRKMGSRRALTGSTFMGGGIVALHYIAMGAMRLPAMCRYSPFLVTLSVLVALAGSYVALWLVFFFRGEPDRILRKAGGAVLMGIAIAGMHYTAMAAATFTRATISPDLSHAVSITSLGIAATSGVPSMVLVLTILTIVLDRLQEQRTLLNELFEQAPEAITLVNAGNRVVRVNREFIRLFGYTPQEVIGHRLIELIVPDNARGEGDGYLERVKHGQRVEAEGLRQRKDGTRFYASILKVPFAMPDGDPAVYAIYRDITERKRADDALRELSAQLLYLQDEERRRLARELHDSTAQKLSALAINLSVVNQSDAVFDTRAERAMAESLALTDECLREIRTLAYLLHPPELDELGLPSALSHYVNGFAQRSGIAVELELSPDLGRLPPERETALFRIVQESLSNIHRHSGSPTARIKVFRSAAGVAMEVHDEGHGMSGNALNRNSMSLATAGVGIAGMRERVRQLGGQLDIHSTEDGTTLKVFLPLN
jgi:PAS domain S-box-containing protein